MVVVASSRACFSKEYTGISATLLWVPVSLAVLLQLNYVVGVYPVLISFKRSTSTSKSMASGESKSYSFRNAAVDCSGVNGL